VGSSGCLGIGIEDIFLTAWVSPTSHQYLAGDVHGPLSLGDLEGVKPQYLANIVVNNWAVGVSKTVQNYELLVMSPTVIERLDRKPEEEQFNNKLYPQNIDLSAAMAASAAAVARHMGAYDQSVGSFKQLQIVLGLGMVRQWSLTWKD